MELCDVPSNPRMIALLEAPGVKHSDLKLQLGLDKALLVSGTRSRRLPRGESPQQELGYGTFKRVIQLPEGTMVSHFILCHPDINVEFSQLDTIEATLDDGLLFISWPRVLSNSAVSNTDSNPSDNMTVGQSPASGELATMANESETVNQPAITVEGSGQQPVI